MNLDSIGSYTELKSVQRDMRSQLFLLIVNEKNTNKDLADKIGISPICLSRFLNGMGVNLINLWKIRNFLSDEVD